MKTARSLTEGAAAVVSIEADTVDAANDTKLVHFTGEATTAETLSDSTFGMSKLAIKLKRNVEMYQWKETSSSRTRTRRWG